MYGRNLFLVCFIWMTKTGHVAGESEITYLWGPNPIKNSFTYEITFLDLHDNNTIQIRYLDYRSGRKVQATYEASLSYNVRTVHKFVTLPVLKDLNYFVIEMQAEHSFDFVAMTYDATTNYGVVRSVPPSFWRKEYGIMLRPRTAYWKVLVLSLFAVKMTVKVSESYMLFENGYRYKSDVDTSKFFDCVAYEPYLYSTFIMVGSPLSTQVEYFRGDKTFGMSVLGSSGAKYFSAEITYSPPPLLNYTFYGQKLKRRGTLVDSKYFMSVPKTVDGTISVVFTNGTKVIIPNPKFGDVYELRNLAKLDTWHVNEFYAIKYPGFEYFRYLCIQQFQAAHVILNPYHKDITEVNITVTGTKEALEDLKLNGEPLTLPDLAPLYVADNIYTGNARITAESVLISSSNNISVYVHGGDTAKLYYGFSNFGPTGLLDPALFKITIRERTLSTPSEYTTIAPEVVTLAETTRTPKVIPSVATTAKAFSLAYNEFNIICNADRYGKDCAKICSCNGKCRMDGSCSNLPCRMGTFGEECKKEDVTLQAVDVSPPELFDGNKDTSTPLRDVKVGVDFKDPTPTNSFSFVFEPGSDLSKITKEAFTIKVLDETTNAMVPITEDYTVVVGEDNIVTVRWEKPRIVQKMEITVDTEQKASSFHVSGGVLVESVPAEEGGVNQADSKSPLFSLQVGQPTPFPKLAKELTDGDRFSTCVDTEEANYLEMTFADNTLLQRIIIFTPGTGKEWKAELLFYDTAETEVLKTEVLGGSERIYPVNVNMNVIKAKIKILSGVLSMCEIQAYADPNGPLKPVSMSQNGTEEASGVGLVTTLLLVLLLVACVTGIVFALLRPRRKAPIEATVAEN